MGRVAGPGHEENDRVAMIFPNRLGSLWISLRQLPDGIQDYQVQCASTGADTCGMLPVDILWISAMAGTAIERASSLIQHWERRFEVCRLHGQSRLRPGTETCAKWTGFLRKFEAKLSALRMRRDVLVGLQEAAQLDVLPNSALYYDETINPEVAERFAAAFAENERRLAQLDQLAAPVAKS
jgi:hypothetical protein